MVRGIQIMQQFWILTFPRAVSAHNARADTYGREILKCSKWPGSYSKLFIGDFEHVKILTRAHVRVVTRTGTRIVSMLTYGIWSLCVLNLVNLWRMDMKISMITWKHKMAPGWRHGWVITLKSFACRFLILTKILWKFEDDCWFCSWDITATKYVQKERRNNNNNNKIRTKSIGDMYYVHIT